MTLLLVVITLLPTLMVMMTSFTKFVVSLSFLRTAMGTQQTPPNSVLVGMALVLTLFAMTPTLGLHDHTHTHQRRGNNYIDKHKGDIHQKADLVIKLCAPMLLLSMSVGVLLAIFQAVTQIHEQTLSFIFKLTVVMIVRSCPYSYPSGCRWFLPLA